MGYWEKKEAREASRRGVKEPEVKESPKNGDSIDFDALDKLESDMNRTSDRILGDVEGIAESIKKQKAIAKDTLSSNYWFAVCFNNDLQKQQFLKAIGFDPSWTFIQGSDFAKAMNVDVKEPNHDYSRERKPNPNFQRRARPISGGFKPKD